MNMEMNMEHASTAGKMNGFVARTVLQISGLETSMIMKSV